MQDAPYMLIPLVNAPETTTLVDVGDYPRFEGRAWRLHHAGYAYCWRAGESVYLHRELLGLQRGDGLQADHINGNRLDNRRSNLRVVTNRENCQNRPGYDRTSKYRGVSWVTGKAKWGAKVKLDYKPHHVGYFDSEIDAARAAEAFRRAHVPFSVPDETLGPIPACCCLACEDDRTCPHCRASFRRARKNQIYCSVSCEALACRARRRKAKAQAGY